MSASQHARPAVQRQSSTGASSTRSRRISLEGKFANLTRKLSFTRTRRTSDSQPPTDDEMPAGKQEPAAGSSLQHGSAFNDELPSSSHGQFQSSPRPSMSLDDNHEEHIVRSGTMNTSAGSQQQAPAPAQGQGQTQAQAHQTDSEPFSVRASNIVESVAASIAPPSAFPTAPATPQNPWKKQTPRIMVFFIGTSLAVLILQRLHSLLAITVAACSAYVLWVQLDRSGADLLWEAEWRTIESKAQQTGTEGETALWINHCLRIIWPLLNSELFTPFIDLLEDSLMQEVEKLGIVHGCRVEDLDQGHTALQIKGFRILDSDPSAFTGIPSNSSSGGDGGDHAQGGQDSGEYINLEVSFSYRGTKRKGVASTKTNNDDGTRLAHEVDTKDSALEARENIHMLLYMMIGLQKIAAVELPVWVSVLGIEGKVRLRLQILPNPPFAKTVAITFPSLPALELSARPLGRKMLIDAMQLPLVSNYILHSVENVIKGFISPRSYTVDVPALLGAADGPQHTYALGVVIIVLHEASHIPAADANGSSDPFVQISFSKAGRPLHHEVRDKELIRLTVFDADRFSADDALGKVEISIDRLIRSYHKHSQEDTNSQMFECREEPLQPMTRGGRISGTLKYSAAFFGLALGEGQSMSPHRQAMLKDATMRSMSATPTAESSSMSAGTSVFEALKGDTPSPQVKPTAETVNLEQFETPFDKFVKNLGLPSDENLLRERYERKQRVRKLVEAIEGAEAAHVAPPQPDRPAGILVWHIHNLDSLEIPSTQKTLSSKRPHGKTKLSTAEDQSEQIGSKKLPSSYVQVVLNDVAVFRTRTKPLNAQPFINSGSERWISDWTKTRIDFIVRDARQRETDAIIGVVGLRLVDVLKTSGRMTDRWSITGGVGYGKIRISLLFRSIDVTIPKALSGWNIGVLEVGACRVSGLAMADFERRDCSLLFESGSANAETEEAPGTALSAVDGATGSEPTLGYVWSIDNPIKVPVRNRYPSQLFVTLRSGRSLGRHITHAFVMVSLNRIPDDTLITRRVPLFHTQNLQTFEQETLRAMTASKQLASATTSNNIRRAPILEELCEMSEQGVTPKDIVGASIRHVGWLEITCVFNSGCAPEHRSLISGDSELRMVYESLFALVDAGQRKPPTTLLSKTRRRKLSLDISLAGGIPGGGGVDLAAGADIPTGGAEDAGPSTPLRHRRTVSHDSSGSRPDVRDPATSDSPMSSMRMGSEYDEDDEHFGEEAAHKRVLRRTERGPAQLGVVRTMAFLKQSGEDAFAKMKTKVNSSSSKRTLSKFESEGVSHI
ncbi:unnamed protein product [Tilletia controversa]|nr:unnamed protein product [Tilletia controversa]CAD6943135.1 unnamed protein product [Tilletia controversa]